MKLAEELGEFIGTFALVFVGIGAVAQADHIGLLGVAAAFGLVLGGMIYAIGHVSGAHFNPAVTLALAVTKRFPWNNVAVYVLAQSLGAVAAAFALRWLFGDDFGLGVAAAAPGITATQVVFVEALATALLVFVIASVATDGRASGALAGSAISATLAFNILWAGNLTGASLNPARAFGPALAAGEWTDIALFLLAPVLGGIVGALAYEQVRKGAPPQAK